MMKPTRAASTLVLGGLLAGGPSVAAQGADHHQVESALQRIGAFVERYYSEAVNVLADVHVRIQPLGRDLSARGRPRRLLYEMRVEWAAAADDRAPEPTILRELLEADGRPPKPGDDLECADPRQVSPEPLGIFLPARQRDVSFTWAGRDREAERDAIVLNYRVQTDKSPTIEWKEECVSLDLEGMTKGKIWADAESGDVLRLDEHLTGMFEFKVPREQSRGGFPMTMTIERADTSIRYRLVEFSDPDETLLLPSTIETMTAWRNAAAPRLLITHEISNYRRFVTGSRIIRNPRFP